MTPTHTKEYRQTQTNDFLILANDTLPAPFLLRDKDTWEDFDEQNLEDYFEKSYSIFQKRLEEFQNGKETISQKEEKNLLFMLETLIHAKNTLEETKKRSRKNH